MTIQPPPSNRLHVPSLLLLIGSALAAALGLGGALIIGLTGVVSLFGWTDVTAGGLEAQSMLVLAWSALLFGVLMVPAAVLSALRLFGKRVPARRWRPRFLLATIALLVWPLIVAFALRVTDGLFAWLVVPPLAVAAVAVPIWWYLEFGRRGLAVGNPHRSWGVIAVSGALSLPVIFTVEIIILVIILFGFGLWLGSRPELAGQLESLVWQFQNAPMDPTQLTELFELALSQPVVLYAAIFFVALLVPMLEELFKPLAVWFLAGRRLTPAQGFWLGMLSGATFALLETLGNLGSASGEGLQLILAARLGTGLLHITTAGLTGWGLAVALRTGRYGRLVGPFLLAVLIHSTWNAFGVVVGFSPLIDPAAVALTDPLLRLMSQASPFVLGALVVLDLLILFFLNRHLRRTEALPPAVQPAA